MNEEYRIFVSLTTGLELVLFNISEFALAKLLLRGVVLGQTRRRRHAVTRRMDDTELKALFTLIAASSSGGLTGTLLAAFKA